VSQTRTASAAATAHRRTAELDVADIAAFLQENLGQRLTALLAGIADPKGVGRWAQGKHAPHHDAEVRLRTAYQVFQLVLSAESPHTVRAWFIGLNPQLDDTSPAEAIAAGRLQEVMAAARSFVAGG